MHHLHAEQKQTVIASLNDGAEGQTSAQAQNSALFLKRLKTAPQLDYNTINLALITIETNEQVDALFQFVKSENRAITLAINTIKVTDDTLKQIANGLKEHHGHAIRLQVSVNCTPAREHVAEFYRVKNAFGNTRCAYRLCNNMPYAHRLGPTQGNDTLLYFGGEIVDVGARLEFRLGHSWTEYRLQDALKADIAERQPEEIALMGSASESFLQELPSIVAAGVNIVDLRHTDNIHTPETMEALGKSLKQLTQNTKIRLPLKDLIHWNPNEPAITQPLKSLLNQITGFDAITLDFTSSEGYTESVESEAVVKCAQAKIEQARAHRWDIIHSKVDQRFSFLYPTA
ncbi:MAG: hypothetical protein ACJAUP_001369 [Cellvibrionaceae bacterium]|jgi:hypothetical protein